MYLHIADHTEPLACMPVALYAALELMNSGIYSTVIHR